MRSGILTLLLPSSGYNLTPGCPESQSQFLQLGLDFVAVKTQYWTFLLIYKSRHLSKVAMRCTSHHLFIGSSCWPLAHLASHPSLAFPLLCR